MTQPNQPQYRFLEVGETVQAGDEWFDGTPCDAAIGESVLGYYKGRIRRPIPAPNGSAPDNLTRELAEALAACAWMIKDRSPSDYANANKVLAKYKERMKENNQ